MSLQTVNASSALTEEADEAQLDGLHQRATHGIGRAHSVFLRKRCTDQKVVINSWAWPVSAAR